jgi:ribosomal protein S18 acetylase RimI-like enzyme
MNRIMVDLCACGNDFRAGRGMLRRWGDGRFCWRVGRVVITTVLMSRIQITNDDREEVAEFIERHWGSRKVLSRGKSHFPHELDGIVERRDGKIVGLVTMRFEADSLELLTVNSVISGQGIGTALILDAIAEARNRGCTSVWLTTTNDNLRAMTLYQRLGFRFLEINSGAVDRAREEKPEIPLVGRNGIRIRDEIVLALELKPYT